jgi:hypothetical protein
MGRLLAIELSTLRSPLVFHHPREAMDDDVEERADRQPEDRRGDDELSLRYHDRD